MAVTLRYGAPPPVALNYDQTTMPGAEAFDASNSNSFARGWRSSALGGDANSKLRDAAVAYDMGDHKLGAALEQQGRDLAARASSWAPEVGQASDINGLGSALSFVGGAAGGARSTLPSIVGNLGGRGLGMALGAPFGPAGVAIGGALGGAAGAYYPAFQAERDEAAGSAMLDPEVRAKSSYGDILHTSNVKGAVNAVLEAAMPFTAGRAMALGRAGVKEGAKRYLAKEVGKEMLEEGATEGVQSLVGQVAQNSLAGKNLGDLDYTAALNDAAAGAVAGGAIGTASAMPGIARAGLGKVADAARDPLGSFLDAGIRAHEADKRKQAQDEIAAGEASIKAAMDAGMPLDEAISKVLGRRAPSITDPMTDDEGRASPSEVDAGRKQMAEREAADIVKAGQPMYPREVVDAAAQFLAGNTTWDSLRNTMRKHQADSAGEEAVRSIVNKITGTKESRVDRGTADENSAITKRLRDYAKSGSDTLFQVADVLTKKGWGEDVAKTADATMVKNPQTAAAMLAWMKGGYNNYYDVLGAFNEKLGKSAAPMLRAAYDAGVRSGLFKRHDENFSEVLDDLRAQHDSDEVLHERIAKGIAPQYEKDFQANPKQVIAKLREIASGYGGNPISSKTKHQGNSAAEDRILKALFPDEQHRLAVLASLHTPRAGGHATESEIARFGELDSGSSHTSAALEGSRDDMDSADHMEEIDKLFNEDDGESEDVAPSAPDSEQRVQHFGRAKAKGRAYDITKQDQRAELAAAKTSHQERESGYANAARVDDVGVVRATLDKLTRSAGKAPSAGDKFLAIERVVRAYAKDALPPRPKQPVAGSGDVAMKDFERQRTAYRKAVLREASKLNRTHRMVRKTAEWAKGYAADLDYDTVEQNLRRYTELDDPKNSPAAGTMWLKMANGELFITNAPQVTRLGFIRANRDGNLGATYSDKETEAAIERSGPAGVYQSFSATLAGVLTLPQFTGEFGYVLNGEAVPVQDRKVSAGKAERKIGDNKVAGRLPNNFRLARNVTMEQVADSEAAFTQRVSSQGKHTDFDPADANPPTRRKQATVLQKLGALSAALKSVNYPNVRMFFANQKRGEEKAAALVGDVQTHRALDASGKPIGASAEYRNALREAEMLAEPAVNLEAVRAKLPEGEAKKLVALLRDAYAAYYAGKAQLKSADESIPRAMHVAIGKWMAHLGLTAGTVDVADWAPESERAKDGLSMYDPKTAIVRDNAGRVRSGNVEMEAQSAVGRSITSAPPSASSHEPGESILPVSKATHAPANAARTDVKTPQGHTAAEQPTVAERLKTWTDALSRDEGKVAKPKREKEAVKSVPHAVWSEDDAKRAAWLYGNIISTERLQKMPATIAKITSLDKLNSLSGMIAEAVPFDTSRPFWAENPLPESDAHQAALLSRLAAVQRLVNERRAELLKDGVKQSKQTAGNEAVSPEAQERLTALLHKILGDDVKVLFEDLGGTAGSWTKDATMNVIRIASMGNPLGASFHEAMHQLLDLMRKHGGSPAVSQMMRVVNSRPVQIKLASLLKDEPAALEQLSDPEEALAYAFQFWMLDPSSMPLGPQTKSLFERIKDFFRSVAGLFSEKIRNENRKSKSADILGEGIESVFDMFAQGAMSDPTQRDAVVKALTAEAAKRDAALAHLGEGYANLVKTVGKFVMTTEDVMRAFDSPYMEWIAKEFNQRAGEAMGDNPSYFDEKRFRTERMMNKVHNLLLDQPAEYVEMARHYLSTKPGQAHPIKEVDKIIQGVRSILNEMQGYIQERGIKRLEWGEHGAEWVNVDPRKDYYTRKWDSDAVIANREQFVKDLLTHHMGELKAIAKQANAEVKAGNSTNLAAKAQLEKPEAEREQITPEMIAQQILANVMNPMAQVDLEESVSNVGMTPAASAVNRRGLHFLNMEVFDKYMSKNLGDILEGYIRNMIQRGEYQHRFGPGGEILRDAVDNAILYEMAATLPADVDDAWDGVVKAWKQEKAIAIKEGKPFNEPFPTRLEVGMNLHRQAVGAVKAAEDKAAALDKLTPAINGVMAMEGTLGADMSPDLRKMSNWITTYENFRVLSMGLFGSMTDIMGVVREGGELSDAWGAFVAGIKGAVNVMRDKRDTSYMMQRAELFGSADAASYASAIGQQSGSVYMTGKAREWSDKLFKYNGMEGWNRGMRAYATQVAERLLLSWKHGQIDMSDPAERARFERLFGKNYLPQDIKLDANGAIDAADPKNVAAINRWVLDAVIHPNAAHRTTWMSDPHWQIVGSMKSFTYSIHAVALKGAVAQARLGNYRPAMVLALGYAPIAIAAGAVKEMLIPGDEPPWMKEGLGGYLTYGWDRAGVLGIPQMYADNLFDPAAQAGPAVNQLQDILTVPLGSTEVKVPFMEQKLGWRDHRVFEEAFGSAPFGSLLRRIGVKIDDSFE